MNGGPDAIGRRLSNQDRLRRLMHRPGKPPQNDPIEAPGPVVQQPRNLQYTGARRDHYNDDDQYLDRKA